MDGLPTERRTYLEALNKAAGLARHNIPLEGCSTMDSRDDSDGIWVSSQLEADNALFHKQVPLVRPDDDGGNSSNPVGVGDSHRVETITVAAGHVTHRGKLQSRVVCTDS